MHIGITDHQLIGQAPSEENLEDLALVRAKEMQKEFQKTNLPDGFRLDEDGVWYKQTVKSEKKNEEGSSQEIWICGPLEVTAYVRDHSNENWARLLEFRDLDNNLHQWIMAMSMMARDGADYREELLNRGLPIAIGSKPKAILSEYIQYSQPVVRARCVLQTGWNGNCFVFPNETIGILQKERLLYQGPMNSRVDYSTRGSLEDWQQMSRLCCGNSRLVFAISAAFASPVLYLLGEENGGFHFRGPSSTGKTTALKVAVSVWGGVDYLQRWRATSNGLEAICAMNNDSLLCLDEIEQMHPTEIGEVAYMLANGAGKIRGEKQGGARKRSSWRLLFLSTGEISLADHIQQGGKKVRAGHEVRILDIPADTGKYGIFEELHGFENAAVFSEHLCQRSRENYGVAARCFLQKLIINQPEILQEIKEIREKIQARILPISASGQIIRACNRFSLVAAAGEIATMYGITGWEIGEADRAATKCFNQWLSTRGAYGLHEEKAALEQVQKFFEQRGDSAFSPWASDAMETKTINRAGSKKLTETGEIEFFVFPQTFKTEICMGLDPSFVSKVCIEHGWIMPGSDGKATRAERMWQNSKKTTRCYRFTPKVLGGEGL